MAFLSNYGLKSLKLHAVLGVPLNRYWLYARRLLIRPAKSYFAFQGAADWDALRTQTMDLFGRKNTKLEICEQFRRHKKKSDETAFQYFIYLFIVLCCQKFKT